MGSRGQPAGWFVWCFVRSTFALTCAFVVEPRCQHTNTLILILSPVFEQEDPGQGLSPGPHAFALGSARARGGGQLFAGHVVGRRWPELGLCVRLVGAIPRAVNC